MKSLLCKPIYIKGNLSSIIYLENNKKKAAFTPDILSTLQMLTTQMTISSRMPCYIRILKEKWEERTKELLTQKKDLERAHKELKITQSQLVQSGENGIYGSVNGRYCS